MTTLNIINYEGAQELIPHHVEMYYDRRTHFWIIQVQTVEGYQIGDAEYIAGKASAVKCKNELEKAIFTV